MTEHRVNTSRSSLRSFSAAAALASVALLASGCGASITDTDTSDAASSSTPTQDVAPWTAAEANTALTKALAGFSADLDELYRQRNEQQTVAVYAVQCEELVPELTEFRRFLAEGRWPARVQPAVDQLIDAQTTYDKGLQICADALDEKVLLAGFRQMDTAPIDALVTRLRTTLSAGGT